MTKQRQLYVQEYSSARQCFKVDRETIGTSSALANLWDCYCATQRYCHETTDPEISGWFHAQSCALWSLYQAQLYILDRCGWFQDIPF